MDINRKNMDALFQAFNIKFGQGFEHAPQHFLEYAGIEKSVTSENVYPYLEQFGGMREWIGDRQIKSLSSKKMTVANRDFEKTVSVKKNDIADDKYGLYGTLFTQLGQDAMELWNDLASEALVSNGNWLDGAAFFGTTRKYGKNTISNKTTSALSETTFDAAYTAMMSYKGHDDKGLKCTPNLLIVGPANRKTAFAIAKDQYSYDATDKVQVGNANKGIVDVLILPELVGTYANYWFLAKTSGIIKPVIVQKRQDPNLVRQDQDRDDSVFNRKELLYGSDARGEAFLSLPHLIYAGIVSA